MLRFYTTIRLVDENVLCSMVSPRFDGGTLSCRSNSSLSLYGSSGFERTRRCGNTPAAVIRTYSLTYSAESNLLMHFFLLFARRRGDIRGTVDVGAAAGSRSQQLCRYEGRSAVSVRGTIIGLHLNVESNTTTSSAGEAEGLTLLLFMRWKSSGRWVYSRLRWLLGR